MMQKKIMGLCRMILADKNTRNLFFFLLLNLMFAFVELFYGLMTNSLGLISDSFHMFFDCSALLLGLAASIIAKWRPTSAFTYGFGRAEVLTGFANGLFLLFIALFIMKEAIERALEPPEVHHERLFVISVMGFIVNLVGIFVFQHGGQCSHGHGAHSHSHSHTHSHTHPHETNTQLSSPTHHFDHFSGPKMHDSQHVGTGVVALDMNGSSNHTSNDYTNPYQHQEQIHAYDQNDHGHNHDQSHSHYHNQHDEHHHDGDQTHHNNHDHHTEFFDREPLIDEHQPAISRNDRGQIMESVFLHILADTLGSVGVMVSAILMNQFGWLIADALCSLFIAILISISVYPLLRNSSYILMQRIPVQLEEKLPVCLERIHKLPGVLSIHDAHFWTLNGTIYVGNVKLEVAQGASYRNVLENTKTYLNQIGVDRHHIQIDQI